MRLAVGDRAPDFVFNALRRESAAFYSSLMKKNNVLIFLRYAGCPLTQLKLSELAQDYDRFKKADADIFVVLQSAEETAAAVKSVAALGKKCRIILDPHGGLYRLYDVWPARFPFSPHGPKVLLSRIRAKSLGLSPGGKEGVRGQLPAVFVINERGVTKYANYGKFPCDWPENKTLLAVIQKLAAEYARYSD